MHPGLAEDVTMFWPTRLIEWVQVVGGVLGGLAVLGGGWKWLRTYGREVRLKAADILLRMEEELRVVLPTYELLESSKTYERQVVPVLQRAIADQLSGSEEIDMLARVDRYLLFLYLCSVLNRDLGVEEGVLKRAYYYHLVEILDPDRRPELWQYLRHYYPRLVEWTEANRGELERLKRGAGARRIAPSSPSTPLTAPASASEAVREPAPRGPSPLLQRENAAPAAPRPENDATLR